MRYLPACLDAHARDSSRLARNHFADRGHAAVRNRGAAGTAQRQADPRKVVIADPGIDDAMAILFALRSPALEVLGITTVFGNADIEIGT
ncbi:MAG: nucleoside hydrolase, partial [Vicinamibacterales bacterium]